MREFTPERAKGRAKRQAIDRSSICAAARGRARAGVRREGGTKDWQETSKGAAARGAGQGPPVMRGPSPPTRTTCADRPASAGRGRTHRGKAGAAHNSEPLRGSPFLKTNKGLGACTGTRIEHGRGRGQAAFLFAGFRLPGQLPGGLASSNSSGSAGQRVRAGRWTGRWTGGGKEAGKDRELKANRRGHGHGQGQGRAAPPHKARSKARPTDSLVSGINACKLQACRPWPARDKRADGARRVYGLRADLLPSPRTRPAPHNAKAKHKCTTQRQGYPSGAKPGLDFGCPDPVWAVPRSAPAAANRE